MNIFYDLETTGISTKHQILTACFIMTDGMFNIEHVKNYKIALNPLEIPAESAIAVNSVDITKHMIDHKNKFDDLITEEQFAYELNEFFLETLGIGYNLIGYNSNKFDIKHIRKLLIKYGYNPYYNYNKFGMIDLLNHMKYFKITKPNVLDIDSLTLGNVYNELVGEMAVGLHDAESDVISCVKIAKVLLDKFNWNIVDKNYKTNNLFELNVNPGDIISIINPYFSEKSEKLYDYQVHCVDKNSILLKLCDTVESKNKNFKVVTRNDFCLAKIKLRDAEMEYTIKTTNQYYSEFPESGVENFIYSIQFKDFPALKLSGSVFDIKWTNSPFSQLLSSQIFTKIRPIRHTTDGLEYDSEIFEYPEIKQFFIKYYDTYLKEEMDKEYPEIDTMKTGDSVVQLIKDYKTAYKELYDNLKNI